TGRRSNQLNYRTVYRIKHRRAWLYYHIAKAFAIPFFKKSKLFYVLDRRGVPLPHKRGGTEPKYP
ncbi:MAG: hypothetical protein J5793_01620, partial [Clostridia bacterium]|nr:hypothetical protein [Clostridia bacterium]